MSPQLADHRFIITADGYASVEPALGQTVHGVLWRITPRDRVTLDGWENVAGKLYRAETMPVRQDGRLHRRWSILPARAARARPKAGYMELVVAAARKWNFPAAYIGGLERWLPAGPAAAGPRKLEDIEWT